MTLAAAPPPPPSRPRAALQGGGSAAIGLSRCCRRSRLLALLPALDPLSLRLPSFSGNHLPAPIKLPPRRPLPPQVSGVCSRLLACSASSLFCTPSGFGSRTCLTGAHAEGGVTQRMPLRARQDERQKNDTTASQRACPPTEKKPGMRVTTRLLSTSKSLVRRMGGA